MKKHIDIEDIFKLNTLKIQQENFEFIYFVQKKIINQPIIAMSFLICMGIKY